MKRNYRLKKAVRRVDRFFCDVGEQVDEFIGKVSENETFDKVFTRTEKVTEDVTRFTKRMINKIME